MACVREPKAEPIPGYRLIEPLGSGGFGEVWKCEAPGGLFKAIKFVFGNLNSMDVDGARAEQEFHAIKRVKEVRHPFVLTLDRIEVVNGELVIVMELADSSLHDAFVDCQAAGLVGIPRDSLLRYIRDAAEALDHMNEKHGLQHLDIKPRNLFLISDRVKVADFGLVNNLERPNGGAGLGGVTPLYAPPETFSGKITERSDQYSLAIVYQELLTGQRPFNGKNVRQLAQQHMQEDPELRCLPEAERAVVGRALSKDPAKRFPNCLAFVRALYSTHPKGRSGVRQVDESSGSGIFGKTLAETMEDIPLEDNEDVLAEQVPAPVASADDLSHLGMTVAQPESGALRPTIIVGVGGFGRRALRELRCRFIDRFGDLNKVPLLRFLYVDTDPEAIKEAVRGTPEVAFTRNEVYHLPLQPVGNYRRRMLEVLNEWLPREKLYTMSRSMQTQGSRALGRLAFVDNHLRLMARLRREIQQATHPDSLYQSVTQTGLALRDGIPRICVIAAAGGGAAGTVVDLGFSVHRLLQQLRHPEAEAGLFLFCGAPSDPATPRAEQANIYATLTELNHFADPAVPFAAQYGADGVRLVEQGNPFASVYLLQQAHRTPESLRDTVAHLGSYLFHELTTPLGLRLDRERLTQQSGSPTLFRSFGTYSVWFPRGLLLRLAARYACRTLMEEWRATGEPTAWSEVEAACAKTLADGELRPESISLNIEDQASTILGAVPADALASILSQLEEQSHNALAHDDPAAWSKQSVMRVMEWAGTSYGREGTLDTTYANGDWRKSKLSRALKAASDSLAEAWDEKFSQAAFALMEHSGRRVAAADAALARFVAFCIEATATHQARRDEQAQRTVREWQQLESAMQGSALEAGGGWGLSTLILGNRTRRSLRIIMDRLTAFARQCLAEELIHATAAFFMNLCGRLEERIRELDFCRQRLRHLQERLDTSADESDDPVADIGGGTMTQHQSPLPSPQSYWETIRQSATVRVVLPRGEEDLEEAAERFASGLSDKCRNQLDLALQDRVLGLLGGLHRACSGSGDLIRTLALPLLDQAAEFLGRQLPVTDVAEVEMHTPSVVANDLAGQIKESLLRSAPLIAGKDSSQQSGYLLVPASEAGKAYGEAAVAQISDLQLVKVPGQAHLMFCREQGGLTQDDLHRAIKPCRAAYEEAVVVPQSSPHSRFDVMDWMPIDP